MNFRAVDGQLGGMEDARRRTTKRTDNEGRVGIRGNRAARPILP
jgi:hypothetical protein